MFFRKCSGLAILLAVLPFAEANLASAQIYRASEMNAEQVRALDRNKTVVLIPGGILEQHGPFLPIFADGYAADRLAHDLADAIVARPGWQVLMFPNIPLGTGGANEIGRKYSFSGTFAVRSTTLRAVYMDLATELGDQGFRWIFLVHEHAAPNHNRALDEAADFFNHTYGGAMVHLFGLHLLRTCCAATAQMLGEEELRENGFGVHADAEETSALLFLRPELVDPGYKRARSVSGNDLLELSRLAKQPGWPGYIGAPRFASAAIGASTYKLLSAKVNELAVKILDGFDYRTLPRYADVVNQVPGTIDINRDALAQEDLVGKRQKDWLNLKEK